MNDVKFLQEFREQFPHVACPQCGSKDYNVSEVDIKHDNERVYSGGHLVQLRPTKQIVTIGIACPSCCTSSEWRMVKRLSE